MSIKYITTKSFKRGLNEFKTINTEQELIHIINNDWSKYDYKVRRIRYEPKQINSREVFAVMCKFDKQMNFTEIGYVDKLF